MTLASSENRLFSARPPFALALGACLSVTLLMSWLRLTFFQDRIFPLGVGLPLLLTLWTRDIRLLYGMAAILVATTVVKVFWFMPSLSDNAYIGTILVSQLIDTCLVTGVVHGLLRARARTAERTQKLDRAYAELETINDELTASNEELAAREEEISRQNEELQSQAEELEQQAEELRQQTEEAEQRGADLEEANQKLLRKDIGLRTLLDSGRWLRSDMDESYVMNGICHAAVQVLGDGVQAAAVAVDADGKFCLKGNFGFGLQGSHLPGFAFKDSFACRVMEAGRTACIENIEERPDLRLPPPVTGSPFRSVIGSPIWNSGTAVGSLQVYSTQPKEWTESEFHIIEWLASQVAVALQAIQAQREVEQKRQDAEEASREKTRFLASVSHDVRTPAHSISLLADLIQKCASDPKNHHRIPEMAKNLWNNAKALVDLVSSVLDITRLDSGRIELDVSEFSLCELVRSVARQAQTPAEAKNLQLAFDVPDEEIWIASDRMKLNRVLANLTSNAIKFTEAGEVKLEILSLGDGGVAIHVRDTGIGIPSEHFGCIFDEFFQLRNPERDRDKGSGLGLAICHRLIKALGFEVQLQSMLGVGSNFKVIIPAACIVREKRKSRPVEDQLPLFAGNPFDGLPILLVEDHDVAREATAGLLAAEGALVCKAANGREAVRLLSTGKHRLLLLDLNLPDFDGIEVLKTIQHQRPEQLRWVMVVSGDVRPERVEEVRKLGASTLIPKPVSLETIREALQQQAFERNLTAS